MRTMMTEPPSEPDGPQEAFPEAAAILRDAGWKPHDGWGVYTRGTLVMGFSPDGQHFDVKNTATAPDSPDTPDDPVEAAQWLVRLRAPAVVIDDVVGYDLPHEGDSEALPAQEAVEGGSPDGSELPAPRGDDASGPDLSGEAGGEGGDAFGEPLPGDERGPGAEAGFSAESDGLDSADADAVGRYVPDAAPEGLADETHGETGEADAGDSGSEDDSASLGDGAEAATDADPIDAEPDLADQPDAGTEDGQVADTGLSLDALESAAIDADFAPIEDEPPERDALDADLFPIRGIAWSEEDEPEAEPDTTGPIAYAASDLDALVREKLGRVSQIARELKAALQDGWTIDEFRSLQNLIVRIDRGEATDDAQARARFVAISERSQAMSRVDAHRDALEAALDAIGKARDYQGAKDFNPEQGWP